MGTGKILPTIIVFSITAMLIFSILPAMADPKEDPDGKFWLCPGEEPKGPWKHIPVNGFESVDKNNNGWVCSNQNSANGVVIDDRRPAK